MDTKSLTKEQKHAKEKNLLKNGAGIARYTPAEE